MKRFIFPCLLLLLLALLPACQKEKPLILTEGESAPLVISIPRALKDTVVTVETGEVSAFAHKFGSGQDFTIEGFEPDAEGRYLLPVEKGARELTLTVLTRDDDVFETAETAVLRLSGDPADFASPLDIKRTFVIEDNDTAFKADLIADFGAKGDGTTDDTEALQAAVDAVAEAGGGIVFLPKGEYVISAVMVTNGMTVMGEEGTVIKRPDKAGRWCRTFSMHYTGEEDSAPFVIRDLTIDGNAENQGLYKSYELEHAHMLFFYGLQQGRIRGAAENLLLQNGVGDGVSVYTNADVGVYNVTAVDVFRGGLVITGGNASVRASNVVTRAGELGHPGGIDIEVDGLGFGDSYYVDVDIHRFFAEDGDIDVSLFDDAKVTFSDCFSGQPISVGGRAGELSFNRCNFVMGKAMTEALPGAFPNRFYISSEITFNDCVFTAACSFKPNPEFWTMGKMPVAPINRVTWLGIYGELPESRLVFNRCKFNVDESVTAYPEYFEPTALYIDQSKGDNCKIILNDCEISEDYAVGIYLKTPAYLEISNLINNAAEKEILHGDSSVFVNP